MPPSWKIHDYTPLPQSPDPSSPPRRPQSIKRAIHAVITPTEQLIYHPCFDGYQCARLELPMDWNRTDGQGAKIALAVTKLPDKVPVTDPRYGGPVFLNPGGPGNSEVAMVLNRGKYIQTAVDSAQAPNEPEESRNAGPKYFDIVSFNPRGINNTTPVFSCFRDTAARQAWKLQTEAEGILGSSEGAFDTHWARHEALGLTCTQLQSTGDGMEEAGERETDRILANARKWGSRVDSDAVEAIRLRNRWVPGHEQLQYWGISYGTALGATFAAMQPHRIKRAVIDGVCDADDYYAGAWLTNLQDADAAWRSFFELCSAVGPIVCPFARKGEDVTEAMGRYAKLLATLKSDPVSAPASGERGPDVTTYSDVKTLVLNAVYTPMESFEQVARLLTDLEQRNGSAFADYKYQAQGGGPKPCVVPGENRDDAQTSILCSDMTDIGKTSKDGLRSYWHTLQNQSETLGDSWTEIRFSCIQWKARPKWRFEGPIAGSTSYPVSFVGNAYDPVTPLRNAITMAERFPGSAVLQQNSVGHCSLSGPSLCTGKVTREYFQAGDLPRHGKVCEVDEKPFHVPGLQRRSSLPAADLALMSALRSLAHDEGFAQKSPMRGFF
ncbi:alpha/beta hydrolase [Aspergillus homomorphus CBS 101889]|uniref:Peptidase S33 tripeptidyl aminopeptidase-like C-terminal domain-containing protein n=1 Tax=Aspergillus homomorphus (strain CBS 101889) TaxID=1450537 RepID=A0A395HUE1_ASPHC|nr:hypothetical protein BO97DRAFT_435595 [Aspergillus homomorphus CBS 101889]RAL11005.1 hypothetical protein BO97DRAFT_435595 [Aspergillus homomorphus CBS 101889]